MNVRTLVEPVNTRCEWAGPCWNTNQAFALVYRRSKCINGHIHSSSSACKQLLTFMYDIDFKEKASRSTRLVIYAY